MTRRRSLGAGALLVALLAAASPAGANPSETAAVNRDRASSGLRALADDGGLNRISLDHTRDMVSQNRLFHTADLGGAVSSVHPDWIRIGENVGVGSSFAAVQQAFMNSSTHRANVLGDYQLVGTATVTGPDGRVWVTETFAKLAGATGKAGPSSPAATTREPATRVVAASPTPNGRGYWLTASDGGVFSFGNAPFLGSVGGQRLAAPITGATATPDGGGYWLVASDGGVFSFGNAPFRGSLGGQPLAAPITTVVTTPDGQGYWMAARDGGVFTFGSAPFLGSLGGQRLAAPITAAMATPDGGGYWLVASDGGVFSFGDAPFAGSLGGQRLAAPVTSGAADPDGQGYWLAAADGGVFSFGGAAYAGGKAGS